MTDKTIMVVDNPKLSLDALLRALHMDETSDPDDLEEIKRMREEVLAIARPKALYGVVQIEKRDKTGSQQTGCVFLLLW